MDANRNLTTRRTVAIIVSIFAWLGAFWLVGASSTLTLLFDPATGEKYCINPLAAQMGMANAEWFLPTTIASGLAIIVLIPGAWMLLYVREGRKNGRRARHSARPACTTSEELQ